LQKISAKMVLQRLSVLNYRNIASATLELSPKINCLIGRNGAGKTNVLDAVYYLSFCRSAYNAVDSQLIRHGEEFFVLEGDYSGDLSVYCGLKRGQKKHFKRNKKEYKRLSEHIGLIPIVMVAPGDTLIIEGGSEERRRLMDVVIAQRDHRYLDALGRYGKALQQRNAMLRDEAEPDLEVMAIYEEQMASAGELIACCRADFVEQIAPLFQHFYGSIADGGEEVAMSYSSHSQRGPLLDIIQRDRWRDRAVGYSLHGVHRDDLEFLLGSHPMKREGSQGQMKTFVIALKLAVFELLKRGSLHGGDPSTTADTMPLLLLDDIFDKLDAQRVEQIVKLVSGDGFGQIVITDTNRSHLDSILAACSHDYRIFLVEGGEVTTSGG